MHPRVYQEFNRICRKRRAGGDVLEVGAVPHAGSLLNLDALTDASSKLGINLDGPHRYGDFEILRVNANDMGCFPDARFDTVLCNAVLEHDPYFWKTVSEVRRVTKPGGLVVVGVPGYCKLPFEKPYRYLMRRIPGVHRYLNALVTSTLTQYIHLAPGDYYRFSKDAVRDVLLEGMIDVEVGSVLMPPRIIGSGRKPTPPQLTNPAIGHGH